MSLDGTDHAEERDTMQPTKTRLDMRMRPERGKTCGRSPVRKALHPHRARRLVAIFVAGVLGLGGIPSAGAEGGPRSREDSIVDAYETLLGRPPGEAELRFWAARLASGGTPLELTLPLARGGSARRIIESLYREALGRDPGQEEIEYWSQRAQTGQGLGDVVVGVLGSPEARARSGDSSAYVTMLYHLVLGRGPDPVGGAYWARVADAPGNDAALITSLWASAEARRRRVRNAYIAVLGREPDPGGLAYWADTGVDEPHISARLAATDEFWRPRIPSALPFAFEEASVLTTTPLGPDGVFFVASFPVRLSGEEFCRRIERGLLEGGADIATACSPQRPFILGVYNDETLMVAATDLRTFTVTIGSRW